jgi:hypothetical protein
MTRPRRPEVESRVPDLPSASAARLQRPRWLDARLVVGVLLVLVSVMVGAKVVAEADDTVPVWAVVHDLAPHTVLSPDDVTRVNVHLGATARQYITAEGNPPVGYTLTRELRRDELLPTGALVRQAQSSFRRVVVEVEGATTAGLRRNAVVDVYVVPDSDGGEEQAPAVKVLDGVSVADDPSDDGGLRGSATTAVVLLVPGDQVAQLLTAQAGGTTSLVQRPRTGADVGPVQP